MFAFRRPRALSAYALVIAGTIATASLPTASATADVLAPIWTGAYIGVHSGAKWSDVDTNFSSSLSATDITGGGHIGYNFGLGGIIIGVEADADLDSTHYDYIFGANIGSYETDWRGTLRGRIGLPVGPALLYATAGYAWTNATIAQTAVGGPTVAADTTFHGFVYGIGAEAYVFPNMSLRLEALRFDYGSDKLAISSVPNVLEEFDPNDTVVRAGITFHLN